jgi:hypothetical protein
LRSDKIIGAMCLQPLPPVEAPGVQSQDIDCLSLFSKAELLRWPGSVEAAQRGVSTR